ncbi:MAG: RNA 2',3'-cyclic phosphodiesterase [Gemmatimonadota bacterium]|nr:RNA 2',3'-cyclic phosphodiesterase [Gemmatimonadota bacterium]
MQRRTVRLFLAINPEPEVRAAVHAAAAPLRDAAPMLSWIDAPRLHLTLKFLGEQPGDVIDRLAGAMDVVARRHVAILTHLAEFGAFPNFRRARVVWIGMDHDPRLELLHHEVEIAADTLGFPLEGRPFRPHVTLARVKERPPAGALQALARSARLASRERFPLTVRSIDLMRSTLAPGGAAYARLHTSPLRES